MENIFKVNGKVKILPLIISILIPLFGSGIVFFITRNSMNIYREIKVPFFAPPSIVFMIVWPILYVLMGIASYRIYMIRQQGKDVGTALFYYIIQLLLNYLWSFIFFSFRLYGLAFLELIILIVFIGITFYKFLKVDKLAAYIILPYVIWVVFALALNYSIWALNEM